MTLKSTKILIDKLAAQFYRELLLEPHYAVFFKEHSVDALLKKQADSLFELLTLSDDQIHERGLKIGKIHVNIGLPFEDLYAGYHLIQKLIVDYFDDDWIVNHHFFHRLAIEKKAVAEGYLITYVLQLRTEIQRIIDKRNLVLRASYVEFSNTPLNWFKDILDHLSDDSIALPEMDECHCPLTDKLTNHSCLKNEERQELLDLHASQHVMGNNFIFFYQTQEYALAVFLLARLNGMTLDLSNRIGLAFQESFIQELQKDPLTHFYLRHDMEVLIERALQDSVIKNQDVSIIMLDLDNFKIINDEHGHLAGDEILRQISQLFSQVVRATDKVFRYGGEEFLILLEGASLEVSSVICEGLRGLIQQKEFRISKSKPLNITASLGVLAYHPASMEKVPSARHFIDQCDRLLLKAKKNGKNRVEYC